IPGRPQLSLPTFAVSLLRRDDLLSLDFLFFNLALEAGGGGAPRLVVKDRSQGSYFVARFDAPQNIAEQAIFEPFKSPASYSPPSGFDSSTPPELLAAPPVKNLAAGPSRLAFQLPRGLTQIEYSVAELLDWANF